MRRLIVFCDGTWKSADDNAPTNVVKMMDAIVPVARRTGADGVMAEVSQISFYTRGVGTVGNILDRLFSGAFGQGLDRNIRDCYRFLVQNYEPGDEIFLFGFSRGAYTARSLMGLIRCCGLVRKQHAARINEAYSIYRKRHPDGPDKPEAVAFREKDSHPEFRLKFIGVWDTVGALGVPLSAPLRTLSRKRHGFHDTRLSRVVENAYHAVAIDEGRYTFEESLWKGSPKDKQKVEQMWFAGAHSDIGGGYDETGLSDIALQWMAEKAAGCGLVLSMPEIRPDPALQPHDSRYMKFLPGNIRDIARYPGWTTESVHPSVIEKMKDARYTPLNLRNYVDRREAKLPPSPDERQEPELRRPAVVRALRQVLGANRVAK